MPVRFFQKLRLGVLPQPDVLLARERRAETPESSKWRPFRTERRIPTKIVRETKKIISDFRRLLNGTRGSDRIVRAASRAWSNSAQLTRMQAEVIGSLIAYRGFAANVLIFGAGHDTLYWSALNAGGRTLVIEDDATWADMVRKKLKSGSILMHTYPTTVEGSQEPDLKKLADFPEPAGIGDTRWDIILIDGPAGYSPEKPGRSLPIYWAHKYSDPWTHVFVDDYERPVERQYCDFFFGGARAITILPSHGTSEMFWRIGQGLRTRTEALHSADVSCAERKITQWDTRFKRLSDAPGTVLINNYKCGFSSSNLLSYTTISHIDDDEFVIFFYRNIYLRTISTFIHWCITEDRYLNESGWLLKNFKARLDNDEYARFLGLMRMGRITDAFRFYVESLDLVIEMDNHTLPQIAIFEYYGNIRVNHFIDIENCDEFERLTGIAFPYHKNNKSDEEVKKNLIQYMGDSEELQSIVRNLYRKDIEFFGRHGIDVAAASAL